MSSRTDEPPRQEEAELFSEILRERGHQAPRLPDDSEIRERPRLAKSKWLVNEFLRCAWTKNPANRPRVVMDYTDDDRVEAFTYGSLTRPDTFVIVLSSAQIRVLELMFNSLCCQETFWPDVKGAGPDQAGLPVIVYNDSYKNIVSSIKEDEASVEDYIPRNEGRRDLADHLTDLAFRCVCWHELRHIMAGHGVKKAPRFYSPKSLPKEDAEANWDKVKEQAMEWDADCWAIQRELEYQARDTCRRIQDNEVKFEEGWQGFRSNFYYIMLASAGFFRLQDDNSFDAETWNTDVYPPSLFRRWMILEHGMEWCRTRISPFFSPEVCEAMHSHTIGVLEQVTTDSWSSYYDRENQLMANEFSEDYSRQIHRAWAELIPELQKHAYCNLLPNNLQKKDRAPFWNNPH